jgi:hypothetical protein
MMTKHSWQMRALWLLIAFQVTVSAASLRFTVDNPAPARLETSGDRQAEFRDGDSITKAGRAIDKSGELPVLSEPHSANLKLRQSPNEMRVVHQWDIFTECFVTDLNVDNEFTEVELNVTYIRPDGTKFEFLGFYEGDGNWQFRCMAQQVGLWRYTARFSNGIQGPSGVFRCVPSTIPGMISCDHDNPMWFGYQGGKRVLLRALHVGDRFFATRDNVETGASWNAQRRKTFLDWAQQQGYNTLSIAGHLLRRNEVSRGQGWNIPELWDVDHDQPDPAAFAQMEVILNDMKRRQIMVYPFAGFCGRSSNFPRELARQQVYLKYTIARLAPYWNLLLMVGGPEPRLKGRPFLTTQEVHRIGRFIAAHDPFGHLLSVHNPTGDDAFKDAAWQSYGILQGPKTIDRRKLAAGLLKNHHPAKPLLAQETLWSGNTYHIRQTQGGYSDADLRKNAYVIMMCAAALVFADNAGNSSSGFTGSMNLNDRRQARHDIIKQVWDTFERFPFQRLRPQPELIRQAQGAKAFCLAKPGQYYLLYLDGPGRVSMILEQGPFQAEWINAQDSLDCRKIGDIADAQMPLQTPATGDDWLLWIYKKQTEDTSGT